MADSGTTPLTDGCALTTDPLAFERAFRIRRAVPADAEGVVRIWETIAAERVYSAVDKPWSVEQERAFLAGLSAREAMHVAEAADGEIVGFQSLDLWSSLLGSMAHVAQLGTFLAPEWRRRGVGRALFSATREFAMGAGFRKLVIQVRGSNASAQSYYLRMGFAPCGRLSRQVLIDGVEDDEILMELFL